MTVRVEQPLDHWFWFEFLNHLYIPLGSLLIPSDAYPTIVLGKSKFVAQNGMIGMLFVVVIWLDYSMLYDILIGIGLGCTPSMFQCLQCLQVFSSLGCSRQMFGLLRSRWFAIYPTKDLQQWRFQRQSGIKKPPGALAIEPARIARPPTTYLGSLSRTGHVMVRFWRFSDPMGCKFGVLMLEHLYIYIYNIYIIYT